MEVLSATNFSESGKEIGCLADGVGDSGGGEAVEERGVVTV